MPDMALLSSVQQQFELHDLAIEDVPRPSAAENRTTWRRAIHRRAQRSSTATVSRLAKPICSSAKGSRGHGPSTSYTPVRERRESCPRALARGEDYILYAIPDFTSTVITPVLEAIQEVEAMEAQVLVSAMTRKSSGCIC